MSDNGSKTANDHNEDDEVIEVLAEPEQDADHHEDEELVMSGDDDEYELHYLNENTATITKEEQEKDSSNSNKEEEVADLTVVEATVVPQIAVSPLNEFDPGICEGGGGRDTPRPQVRAGLHCVTKPCDIRHVTVGSKSSPKTSPTLPAPKNPPPDFVLKGPNSFFDK